MLTSAGPNELLLLFTLLYEKQRASEETELCSNSPTERSLPAHTMRERQTDRKTKGAKDRRDSKQRDRQMEMFKQVGRLIHSGSREVRERQMVHRQKSK